MRTIAIHQVSTLLLGMASLVACGGGTGNASEAAAVARDTIAAQAEPEIVPDLLLDKVEAGPLLQALFPGTLAKDGKSVDWTSAEDNANTDPRQPTSSSRSTAGKPITFGRLKDRAVVLLQTFTVHNGQIADCRACTPTIGLAIFQKVASGWQLKAVARRLGGYGANGKTWPLEVVKAGPDRHFLRIAGAFGMGGQNSASYFFFSLAEDGTPIRMVHEQSTLEEYEDPENNATIGHRATMEFVPSGGDYDDIVATYTRNDRNEAGSMERTTRTETYHFDPTTGKYDSPDPRGGT